MYKISEKEDLSRQVLKIDIDSPVFLSMLQDLNSEIQRCITKVYDNDFEGGEISLKLTIEMPNAYKIFPRVGENGKMVEETYMYRKPLFEHKVTTTLKKQFKHDGSFTGEREIQLEDGKFIAVPIEDVQMKIDDVYNQGESFISGDDTELIDLDEE